MYVYGCMYVRAYIRSSLSTYTVREYLSGRIHTQWGSKNQRVLVSERVAMSVCIYSRGQIQSV